MIREVFMDKILVIDDNPEILKLVEKILKRQGYLVFCKSDLQDLSLDDFKGYDLILLDVMLGAEYDGFELCAKIRDEILTPIVFLTAKTMDEDLLQGFAAGGDDYIKKPFHPKELLARIEAHIRRDGRKREKREILVSGGVNIYFDEKAVYAAGEKINLTGKEFLLVELLSTHPNKIFTIEEIYEKIYDPDSDALFRGVSEYIYQIRRKFREYGINPIRTKRGVGYQWKEKH